MTQYLAPMEVYLWHGRVNADGILQDCECFSILILSNQDISFKIQEFNIVRFRAQGLLYSLKGFL